MIFRTIITLYTIFIILHTSISIIKDNYFLLTVVIYFLSKNKLKKYVVKRIYHIAENVRGISSRLLQIFEHEIRSFVGWNIICCSYNLLNINFLFFSTRAHPFTLIFCIFQLNLSHLTHICNIFNISLSLPYTKWQYPTGQKQTTVI